MARETASDPMPARHVFKFVVSGTELSQEHQSIVQARVARAGVEAIADLDIAPRDTLLFRNLEWLGIWIHLINERIELDGLNVSGPLIADLRRGDLNPG